MSPQELDEVERALAAAMLCSIAVAEPVFVSLRNAGLLMRWRRCGTFAEIGGGK